MAATINGFGSQLAEISTAKREEAKRRFLEHSDHFGAIEDMDDRRVMVFNDQGVFKPLSWSATDDIIDDLDALLAEDGIPAEVVDAFLILDQRSDLSNKRRLVEQGAKQREIEQRYPVDTSLRGLARQNDPNTIKSQNAFDEMMRQLDKDMPFNPVSPYEFKQVSLGSYADKRKLDHCSEILAPRTRARLIASNSKALVVAQHPSMALLWLFYHSNSDIAMELGNLVSVSPDFIASDPLINDAVKILAKHFPVLYDERRNEGYRYSLASRNERKMVAHPVTTADVPAACRWCDLCAEHSLITDEMGSCYDGVLSVAERRHKQTIQSEKAFMGDMFLFHLVAPLLDPSDALRLYPIADSFASHRRIFQELSWIKGAREDDDLMDRVENKLSLADIFWYGHPSSALSREVYDALEKGASDWDMVWLVQRQFENMDIDFLLRKVEEGMTPMDVLRNYVL